MSYINLRHKCPATGSKEQKKPPELLQMALLSHLAYVAI